jgi:hypothetical protein
VRRVREDVAATLNASGRELTRIFASAAGVSAPMFSGLGGLGDPTGDATSIASSIANALNIGNSIMNAVSGKHPAPPSSGAPSALVRRRRARVPDPLTMLVGGLVGITLIGGAAVVLARR